MNLRSIPFLDRLDQAQRILLAGAGGGFDVFCGLPLYFHLRGLGKDVQLANLTFSNLYGVGGRQLAPEVMEITAESGGRDWYFPEKFLCRWLQAKGIGASIQCFFRTGAKPLRAAYEAVCAAYGIDTILLVDGGTDSLMRGDEAGLGTPGEDIASISAASRTNVSHKLLACLGFGVDAYHGVVHAHFLENVAALSREGGYLGAFSLLREMEEARLYLDACDFVFRRMPDSPSIVNASICSAIRGEYGDFHATERTRGSKLWINPLMPVYWGFELDAVAGRCLYLDLVGETQNQMEILKAVEGFREKLRADGRIRPTEPIPV